MDSFSVIGQSVPRLESEEKVTGRLKYLEDLKLAGLLPAKILRSPHAHATIDRKSTRLNSSHIQKSRMPSSA